MSMHIYVHVDSQVSNRKTVTIPTFCLSPAHLLDPISFLWYQTQCMLCYFSLFESMSMFARPLTSLTLHMLFHICSFFASLPPLSPLLLAKMDKDTLMDDGSANRGIGSGIAFGSGTAIPSFIHQLAELSRPAPVSPELTALRKVAPGATQSEIENAQQINTVIHGITVEMLHDSQRKQSDLQALASRFKYQSEFLQQRLEMQQAEHMELQHKLSSAELQVQMMTNAGARDLLSRPRSRSTPGAAGGTAKKPKANKPKRRIRRRSSGDGSDAGDDDDDGDADDGVKPTMRLLVSSLNLLLSLFLSASIVLTQCHLFLYVWMSGWMNEKPPTQSGTQYYSMTMPMSSTSSGQNTNFYGPKTTSFPAIPGTGAPTVMSVMRGGASFVRLPALVMIATGGHYAVVTEVFPSDTGMVRHSDIKTENKDIYCRLVNPSIHFYVFYFFGPVCVFV
jgi:hypothetical protein